MKDENKTKAQLISELKDLRHQIAEFKKSKVNWYSEIIESIPHPFYIIDAIDYSIKLANSAAQRNFQSGKTTCHALAHDKKVPCGRAGYLCPLEEAKKNKKPVKVEHVHYDKNGDTRNVEVHGFPIFDNNGNMVELIEFCLDITKRKEAEKELHLLRDHLQELVDLRTTELKESEERYRAIFEQAADAIIVFDTENGEMLWFNSKAHEYLGYTYKEFKKLKIADFEINESSEQIREHIKKINQVGSDFFETKHKTKDGEILDVQVSSRVISLCGKTYIQSMLRDITEHKLAEEKLKKAFDEKEILLKEIQDRIKNNLQLINSLLSLQASKIKNKEIKELCLENRNRILSMAIVHQKMYDSKDFASVDIRAFIQSLKFELFQTYNIEPDIINMNIDVQGIFLGLDKAVPCGMLINELISNSIKYANPGNKKGDISISMNYKNGNISLIISDNGIGLPENIVIRKPETLGLRLVKSLIEQLNGSIEMNRNGGTTYKIMFKEKENR